MLQRAASNAYSWWWASHIRTKQSKWLDQNLQDMEEKVQSVLKLIEEDGDSFAKRAEMYFKNRPELIHFVEETYRAYRSLAERYDHISTELQNANNTIASVFPEQVQFAMDDEDEYPSTKTPRRPPDISKGNIPNVPPKGPTKDLRSLLTKATEKNMLQPQRSMKSTSAKTVPKSGLTKPQAREEIDKTQKQILSLQTEKEFVKSSYENGLAKYWEIENQIKGMQDKVCVLQDEFGDGTVIEDDEARNLMAAAALKSCQQTLVDLQAKQETTAEEARVESKRVKDARKNLETLKNEFHPAQPNPEKPNANDESVNAANEKSLDQEVDKAAHQKQKLELLREKIKEHYDAAPDSSLTVSEMAEKIDELVTKVISLESAVSSQTALVKRLRSENDEIQEQIKNLEGDKATLVGDKKDLSEKLKEMEEKLHQVQDLNQSVENQNDNLQTHFTEATCNLDHISHKLEAVKPDEEVKVTGSSETKEESLVETKLQKQLEGEVNAVNPVAGSKVLQEAKSDEELKPTVSLRKDEELPPELRALKESTEHKEMAKSTDGSIKATDALSTSAGKDVSQSLEIKNAVNPVAESKVLQEAKSDEVQPTVSLRKDEELPPKVRPLIESTEHKEMEKSTDGSATDALSTSAGNQGKEVSQSPEIEKSVSPVAGTKEVQETKSDGELKATVSHQKEEESLDEGRLSKESIEHKQTENPADGSLTATDAPSTSAGNQGKDVCESPEINNEVVEQAARNEDEPDWQKLFVNGMEGREKILLTEYTITLRNYKDLKKKFSEAENDLFETSVQIKELKSASAMKDEEIKSLHKKLDLLLQSLGKSKDSEELKALDTQQTPTSISADRKEDDEFEGTSEIEEKFRSNIDELLEENLDFWLKFSASFHQVQQFETTVQDLQSEISKLEEKTKKQDGSSHAKYSMKSDARPIYKHLMEIQTELNVWLEKGALLKDELQCRFTSLCDIQEEITKALKTSAEDGDFKFTSYQAAKFQGEILNMKQENNKVADELQAGLDHVNALQIEIEKTMAKLNEDYRLVGSKKQPPPQLAHSESRSRVPLRSFIFGVTPKKQKRSIFSVVAPAMHKRYQDSKAKSSQL
ncbi:hypothetical protein ACFX2J_000508 [Malus domestica]|uniref:protein NETWORKED 2D-like n=1 Tax=Malus domestica TaxID=3750 RepID=UPI0010AB1404|nr:protein NETWORKED 2D-like [Malus domestica]